MNMNEKAEYELIWRNKWLTADAESIDDMIAALQAAAEELRAMKDKGVVLDADGSDMENDCARLVTTDPAVAKEYDFTLVEVEEDDLDAEDFRAESSPDAAAD
jgi:hypothetical protein